MPLESGVELHVIHWDPPLGADPGRSPVLLVHGLASNARLWDGVARRLARLGHHVVAVDQRGHGRSSKPDAGYDMATVADDLAALIDVLQLDRPVVVGQSWGANVVLELAARHPNLTRAVGCVDGGFIELADRFADWEAVATTLAPPPLAGTPLERIEAWLAESAADWPPEGRAGTLANFEVRDDGTVAPWLTLDRHLLVLRGLWEHRPSQRYAQLTVPVLWMPVDSGDAERSGDKRAAIAAAERALDAHRTHWFVNAHHDVHAQRPDEVAALIHLAATDPACFHHDDEVPA